MIGRLVITSVERGLGSGPGFQPVLRTRGMRPAVAERLRLRSGYPHPYPFGDRRNPEVFFHRVESVAGQRLHVLARVGDAGSDYSGRSNRLSDLLVLDEAACRQLPAGPAFAAAAFPWTRAWSSEARETDEAIGVPGADPCDSGAADCRTWAAITGDAGWAGELAKSFIDGRNALLVARQGDDVLRLFSEALRLLPPEQRWNVTFNTCEIEPFPASWRAIRSDITRTPAKGDAKTLRFDLETIARTKSRAPDHAYATFARGEGPVPWQTKAADVPSVEIPSRTPKLLPQAIGADHSPERTPDDVGEEIRRRRQHRAVRSALNGADVPAPGKSSDNINTTVWVVISLVTIGLVLASVIWFVGNPQKLLAMLPRRGPHQDAGHSEVAELETQEQKNARETLEEENEKRQEREKQENEKRAQEQQDRAVAEADAAAEQAREREAAELRRTQAEQAKAEKQLKQKHRDAIADFRRLPAVVRIVPTGSNHKPDGELCEDVDFGPYPVDYLKEPAFSVACPESRIDGAALSLWIEPVDRHDSGTPAWRVLSDVPRKFGIGDAETERQHICSLVADGGRLWMKWQAGVTESYPGVRLLQNSVLIASCRNPEGTTSRHEIRLAEPVTCPLVEIDPRREKQTKAIAIGDRLKDITKGVSWHLTVTSAAGEEFHEFTWQQDERRPMPESGVRMGEIPLGRPVPVTVDQVGHDGKGKKKLVRNTFHFELSAELTLIPASGDLTVITKVYWQSPDTPKWLKDKVTVDEALRQSKKSDESGGPDPALPMSLQLELAAQAKGRELGGLMVEEFCRTLQSDDGRKASPQDFEMEKQAIDEAEKKIRIPGQNYERFGGGLETYNDLAEYENEMRKIRDRREKLVNRTAIFFNAYDKWLTNRISCSETADGLSSVLRMASAPLRVEVKEIAVQVEERTAGDTFRIVVGIPATDNAGGK